MERPLKTGQRLNPLSLLNHIRRQAPGSRGSNPRLPLDNSLHPFFYPQHRTVGFRRTMAHFGMLIPPWVGHLNPGTTLGRELQRRGHRVTVLSFADARARVLKAGLEFHALGHTAFPLGEWDRLSRLLSVKTGFRAGRFTVDWLGRATRVFLAELPSSLRQLALDGLVMDQVCFGAESVADSAGMPLVVACNALPIHLLPDLPPHSESWAHSNRPLARLRIWCMRNLMIQVARPCWLPIRNAERAKRRTWNASQYLMEVPPSLAHVAQLPECLDFPSRHRPDHFHHTGPWHEPNAEVDGDFDFSWRDSRPLIYASLGTLQNGLEHIYQVILDACADLPVQLVLTLGRKEGPMPQRIPSNARVLGYGPQLALLRKADMAITHAGMNSTLEALALGLPLLALPITNDQPGVAARIRHGGVGDWLPLRGLTPQKLETAIERVRLDPGIRSRARACADLIARIDGLKRAADIVETAFLQRCRIRRVGL